MCKLEPLTFILAMSCLIVIAPASWSAETSEPTDPQSDFVNAARIQFEQKYSAWRQYIEENGIGCSSLFEPYVENKAFHDLVELGPVAVPWFIEESRTLSMMPLHVVLRANWGVLAGYSRKQSLHVNMYDVLDNWWKTVAQTAPSKFSTRMIAFRTKLAERPQKVSFSEIRVTEEWRKLRKMGLLGVPSTIERIKSGVADEHDYRLLELWTAPIEYTESGFPKVPEEKEVLSEEKKKPEFWLSWWESNSWQFWWL